MKKLNGFENFLIKEGLKRVTTDMKKEIRETESSGKRHIMTEGYVDLIVKELLEKITNFTKKEKK